MVARAEVDRFRAANAELSSRTKEDLEAFFRSLNLAKPEAARDALIEFLPLLVEQYGQVAATLAAEWYEETRIAAGVSGAFRVLTAPGGIPAEAVIAKVRYLAKLLWGNDPTAALSPMLVAADKYVKQPGRSTIAYNAEREGVRWARVPSGAKTCAWCLTLASRDAVYLSERSASKTADGSDYHGDCDCVPTRIASIDDYPEGYDTAEMYEMYQAARDASGSGDIRDISAAMRRLFPDHLNDGVHTH